MPARVVVVLDEPRFADKTASALRAQGHDALALADPMTALDLLEKAERLEVLITCLHFPPGKPNGIALGLMARSKRPGIRVLFVGPADLEKHAEGIGTFMISPVTESQVVEGVSRMLETAPAYLGRLPAASAPVAALPPHFHRGQAEATNLGADVSGRPGGN
jgi:DNA-binding NtrC family response regulator